MNPKMYVLALFVAAAAGCASVPVETAEQKESRCAAFGLVTGVGQQAKNDDMPQAEFDKRLNALMQDKQLNAKEKEVVKQGLTRGYAGLYGAHPGIMAQKAFDDCMAAP
jgi:hypothetical protein